jgi:hypothetical protein
MEIFDWIFIISGFIFFTLIIGVFISAAKERMNIVRIIGIIFLILIFPMVMILINYILIGKGLNFIVYVILILSYLIVELFLDFIFKFDFRSKLKTHIPYIILEYAACFSFVFGSLRLDLTMGWTMSIFFWIFLGVLVYYLYTQKKKKSKS